MKDLLQAMKENTNLDLEDITFLVLSSTDDVKTTEKGEEAYTKLELEVGKGHGVYSKIRLTCKIPYTTKLKSYNLQDSDVYIKIPGIHVSYTTSTAAYTKGDGLEIMNVVEGED